MNILLDDAFTNWGKSFERNPNWTTKQNRLLKKNDITYDDLIELFIYFDKEGKFKNAGDIGKVLYYFYRTKEITDKVEFIDRSAIFVDAEFGEEFYLKLWNSLSADSKKYLLPFIPGSYQTPEMLKIYFNKNFEASFDNYKGEQPSEQLLLELLDVAFIQVVRTMKKEWWTKKLKDKALSKDKLSIIFMSKEVITKNEIMEFLDDYSKTDSLYNMLFRSKSVLDKEFREDQEIRALFASKLRYLTDVSQDFYNECNCDFYNYYLDIIRPSFNTKGLLKLIPSSCLSEDVKDKILEKLPAELLIEMDKLSDAQLLFLYDKAKEMRSVGRSRIVRMLYELFKRKLFKVEMLKDFAGVTFEDLEYSMDSKSLKEFMTSEVIDYFFQVEDKDLFKNQKNMKYAGTLDKEKFFILMKNLPYNNLKARLNFRVTEDDFAYFYFKTKHLEDKKLADKIFVLLLRLEQDNYIQISEEFKKLLNSLPDEVTYDNYKDVQDIFIF